jgi:hypothetical protein
MSTEKLGLVLSFPADEDLRSYQYCGVVLTATGTVRLSNAITDICIGILQNKPNTGEEAVVAMISGGGISKCVIATTSLAAGIIVSNEYVSATDNGKMKATPATAYTVGLLLEGGAEDELGSVLLGNIAVI